MLKARIILAGLGLLLAVPPISAQEVDWASLFRDITGPDPALRQATDDRFLDKIYPKLCSAQADALEAEIPGLLDQLNRKEDIIRLQASAVLYVIGQCRQDSEVTLARAIPALIDHTSDPMRKIPGNSMRTLVELKPGLPDLVASFLVQTVKGKDDALAAIAMYGIARKVTPSSEAEGLLGEALLKGSLGRKKAAINAILSARVTDPFLMTRLGEVLGDADQSVVKTALNAISHLGPRAIDPNRQPLASLAGNSQDAEIAALAKQLLERDTSH